MSIGVEAAFVDTYYDEQVLNDSIAYSAGVFLETQLSNYLKLRIAGGYQNINPSAVPSVPVGKRSRLARRDCAI